jgi:hypothetical protein
MHLRADMVRDEAHDTLAIVWRQTFAGIDETARQPIDPEPTVGIKHDLDDFGIFQEQRDGWTERGAQHACATRSRFLIEMVDYHLRPQRGDRELRS